MTTYVRRWSLKDASNCMSEITAQEASRKQKLIGEIETLQRELDAIEHREDMLRHIHSIFKEKYRDKL